MSTRFGERRRAVAYQRRGTPPHESPRACRRWSGREHGRGVRSNSWRLRSRRPARAIFVGYEEAFNTIVSAAQIGLPLRRVALARVHRRNPERLGPARHYCRLVANRDTIVGSIRPGGSARPSHCPNLLNVPCDRATRLWPGLCWCKPYEHSAPANRRPRRGNFTAPSHQDASGTQRVAPRSVCLVGTDHHPGRCGYRWQRRRRGLAGADLHLADAAPTGDVVREPPKGDSRVRFMRTSWP